MPIEATYAIVLSAVYALAAVQKSRSLRAFEDYLRPLLRAHSRVAAMTILGVEGILTCALLLSAANGDFAPAAGTASLTFLALAVVMYSALLAVGGSSQCHCFGELATRRQLDPSVRPALFALRTVILVTLSVKVLGASMDAAASISIATVATLSAAIVIAIVRERQLLKRKPHPRAQEFAPYVDRLKAHTWWVNGHPREW